MARGKIVFNNIEKVDFALMEQRCTAHSGEMEVEQPPPDDTNARAAWKAITIMRRYGSVKKGKI